MHFAIDHHLARIFAFDAVDLAANRSGHLSPDQDIVFRSAVRLGRRRTARIVPFVGLLAVAAVVAVLGTASEVSAGLVAALAVGLGVPLTLVGALSVRAEHTHQVLERPAVRSVEGRVTAEPSATPGAWWLRVGEVRFPVASGDVDAFRDDAVYRIYYLDGVMGRPALLSAEVSRR